MNILIPILSSIIVALINVILVRVMAPTRVGLLARLIPGEGSHLVLQLAVETLHVDPVSGPVVIEVMAEYPGALLRDAAELRYYAGPESDEPGVLAVRRTPVGLTISIAKMRGMKTWTFEIACAPATRRVFGVMHVPRRPLQSVSAGGLLAPVQQALKDPGVIEWAVDLNFANLGHIQSWRTFNYESIFVLILLILGGLTCYFTFAFTSTSESTSSPDRRELPLDVFEFIGVDILFVIVFIAVVCVLFYISRPRWSSVAQGYLERRSLRFSE